jgi:hypothetical protein
MGAHWYYQIQNQVIGPVKASELKRLAHEGSITPSTLLRRGEDREWMAAVRIEGLFQPTEEAEIVDEAEPAEWFFSQEGRRLGPVPLGALRRLAESGRLRPEELVWKEGMAGWQSVGQVPGILVRTPAASTSGLSTTKNSTAIPRSHSWLVRFGAAALLLCGLLGTWLVIRARTAKDQRPVASIRQAPASNGAPGMNPGLIGPLRRPPFGQLPTGIPTATFRDPAPLLGEAINAVRSGQLPRAIGLLDRYLADPAAKDREKASALRRELALSTSANDAGQLARNLSDQELRDHLRDGARSLSENLETAELRPYYQNTLMLAFRQENARRRMVPREAIAQRPDLRQAIPDQANRAKPREPDLAENGNPAARRSLLEAERALERKPRPRGQQEQRPARDDASSPTGPVEIDQILAAPTAFRGQALVLNGLFKIGTRISEVKEPKGQVVGLSIPVARCDDRKICTGDRKVEGHELYLVLDDQVAPVLGRVFNALKLKPSVKPTFRAILAVSVREIPGGNGPVDAMVINSLEILGMCDYLRVARHEYNQAFRVVEVRATGGRTHLGEGAKWVELLGGEEKFVLPIRRKFRDLQRRAATDSRNAIMESMYQRELSNVMRAADRHNAIRAMEAATWRRIMP